MLKKSHTLSRQSGEADPIAAGPPRRACSPFCIEVHADKELEACAGRIIEQVFKCRGDVRFGWITDVQGKSVEAVGLLERMLQTRVKD